MSEDTLSSFASQELSAFRQALHDISALSTIGLTTADGVSPRNAAIERLAWTVTGLPTTGDQLAAIDLILQAGATLPYDQDAHIIATLIHDLVIPDRIALRRGGHAMVGERLLRAGLKVAPHLVPEGIAFGVLKFHLHRLVDRRDYAFADDVYDRLDDVGFNNPGLHVSDAAAAGQSPLHQTEWLRSQIESLRHQPIGPDLLGPLIENTAALPDELRGSVLVMLVNLVSVTARHPGNAPLNERLRLMLDGLPSVMRITALEAFYNQMNLLPRGVALQLHPHIHDAVARLPESDPVVWFAQSRRDLAQIVTRQGEALRNVDLGPDESLIDQAHRMGDTRTPTMAAPFTRMSGAAPTP